MAWSAKLQSGSGGTQGVNEWQCVYDASTQTELKLKYNFSLGDEAPEVLYHTPDNGSPIPVRANGRNRLLFLTVHIPIQSSRDAVLNILTPIARLVDGDTSQAIRYWTDGDVNKVRVAIKPDGATYTTYFDVLEGFIDASQAFTNPVSVLNAMAYDITIALTCTPYGYGDSFTLNNMLASSPHFLEDSNSDGLADGWAKINGGETTSLNTTNAIAGGRSQHIVAGGANYGIYSLTVSNSSDTSVVGFACVRVTSGTAQVRIYDVTGTAMITSTEVNSTNATRTITDTAGGTWYWIETSTASLTSGNDVRLAITAKGGAATFDVDCCYLRLGTTTAPPAFASASSIYNVYEPTVATTNINYLDVWGIPGDAPALVDFDIEWTESISDGYYVIGALSDGSKKAAAAVLTIEDNGLSDVGGGTYTSGNAATDASKNTYGELVSNGTDGVLTHSFSAAETQAMLSPFRVLAYCAADSACTIQMASITPSNKNATFLSDAQSVPVDITLEVVDIGLIIPAEAVKSGLAGVTIGFRLTISGLANLDSFYIDKVELIPTKTLFGIYLYPDGSDNLYLKNDIGQGYTNTGRFSSGYECTVPSGNVMTRFMIAHYQTDGTYDVSANKAVSVTVTPRTRHLLGTI